MIKKPEQVFLSNYKHKFVENFVTYSKKNKNCILSESAIRTIALGIYDTAFVSLSKTNFAQILENAFKSGVDFSDCLTKSMMMLIRDYIDYLLEISSSLKEVKHIVELGESLLTEASRIQREHIEELRTKLREKEQKLLGDMFSSIFSSIKQQNIPVKILTFFKQVPVACSSSIKSVGKDYITISLSGCPYLKAFYENEELYLKISNAPKPIKVKVLEIFPDRKVLKLKNPRFEDIPQEKRKFVRVEPPEPFEIRIKSNSDTITGVVSDISVGGIGILIQGSSSIKEGKTVSLFFSLGEINLSIEGTVRYTLKLDGLTRMGIEFKLDPKAEEIITNYIMKRQFEILKELKLF